VLPDHEIREAAAAHEAAHCLVGCALGCTPLVVYLRPDRGCTTFRAPFAGPWAKLALACAGPGWDSAETDSKPWLKGWSPYEGDRKLAAAAFQEATGLDLSGEGQGALFRRFRSVFPGTYRDVIRSIAGQLSYKRVLFDDDIETILRQHFGTERDAALAHLRGLLADALGCRPDDLLAPAVSPAPDGTNGTPAAAKGVTDGKRWFGDQAGKARATPERRKQLWTDLFAVFEELRDEAQKSWGQLGRKSQDNLLDVFAWGREMKKDLAAAL
jgi:hypothetical protein